MYLPTSFIGALNASALINLLSTFHALSPFN